MAISKQFWGYDCCAVDNFINELIKKKSEKTEAHISQYLEQIQRNSEAFRGIQAISRQLEESHMQEQLYTNRLLEQLQMIEEAYCKGEEIISYEKESAEAQIKKIQQTNKLLHDLYLHFTKL
jgi:hypothetical protein